MRITPQHAQVIANNKVEVLAEGPNNKGKYRGEVVWSEDHPHFPHLLIARTPPVYYTRSQAIKDVERQVALVKKLMLNANH